MKRLCFCTLGQSRALCHARNELLAWGYDVRSELTKDVTHILLPVPTMPGDLVPFPEGVRVFGGNLPALPDGAVDFLQDPYYLAENAAITAHCALLILMQEMPRTLSGARILVIGWGRIGKCLVQFLTGVGARVTVAARAEADRAMLQALGLETMPLPLAGAEGFDGVINTVPAPVLEAAGCGNAFLLDLASQRGIGGDQVHWRRGLPGQLAPQSAGALMAKTALRYALGKE